MADELLKATHTGKMIIGDKELICAVLEDGTRVLSATALFKAFGRSRRGKNLNPARRAELPRFLESKSLKPYVDKTLTAGSNLMLFFTNQRLVAIFLKAIMPKFCQLSVR